MFIALVSTLTETTDINGVDRERQDNHALKHLLAPVHLVNQVSQHLKVSFTNYQILNFQKQKQSKTF